MWILTRRSNPLLLTLLHKVEKVARLKAIVPRHPMRDAARECCFADTGPRLSSYGSKLGPGCRASYSIALAIELSLGSGMTLFILKSWRMSLTLDDGCYIVPFIQSSAFA